MKLPIEVVPGAHPSRRFRWQQVVTSPLGTRTVEHVGALPTAVENAVVELVSVATQLGKEVERLQKMVDGLAAQLSKRAEKVEESPTASADSGDNSPPVSPPSTHKRKR